MTIQDQLLKNRPTLSAGSVKTYESNLRNMYIKIFGSGEIDLEKFNEVDKFKEFLKDVEPKNRKGKYSALFILTGLEEYQELMMDDIDKTNSTKTREMTDKQKENFVSQHEIQEKMAEMRPKAELWFKQKNLPKLQDYLILVLYGGFYIAPRRSLDYTSFKLRNIDESRDNFLQLYTKDKKMRGRLVFNEYKTKKRGQDVIEIPTDMLAILRKWKRTHDHDYLFFTGKGEPINAVVMNQRIEKIFGKKVGVNGFRHSYMTERYGHIIDDESKMAEDFMNMGSSVGQKEVYIQKTS